MTVVAAWQGALTDTAIRVRAHITGTTARLALSLDPGLIDLFYTDNGTADPTGWVDLVANGLVPNTQYWWAIEDTGVLDLATTGAFQTMPTQGQQASYTIAVSSCAGDVDNTTGWGISNHPVFDTIRERSPLFFADTGDLAYPNNTTADIARYRGFYDQVLAQSRQHLLYRMVPLVYTWDDHDYATNNSDRTAPGRPTAAQAFRERVPSYALSDPDNIGCWQSFECGRILYIASDCRSYRSPSTDPDGPSKTMLGAEQKAWMANVLANSQAKALIWLNPDPWMGGAQDTWAGYDHERNELVALFDQYGWLDRMVCLNGDYHGLAMDDGGGNSWGGFPVAVFGSMDSIAEGVVGNPTDQYDLGPTSPGSNRYGTVRINDNGATIDLILTGYIGNDVWNTTALHIVVTTDEGPPPPPPPVVRSVGEFRTHVTWLGCDLVSGRVITELPDITGTVSRVLGAYTSAALTLPVPLAGPGALGPVAFQATDPGRTMIVAVVNDAPTWAGIVLTRSGGVDAVLQLGCVSLEGYLDRRYVGDHTWLGQDEAGVIGAGLADDAGPQGIGLIVDAPPTGVRRDRTYVGNDDATVYSRLRELMSVQGGPEWTIDVDWLDDNTQDVVVKTLRIRSRIGIASSTPAAVFQNALGASETRYTYAEDYSDGKGANYIIATSTGEGEDRPTSSPASDIRTGWPRYERRFSPSTSVTDLAVLDAHAADDLAVRVAGINTFKLTTRWNARPRLNLDWRLGDDVAWDLKGHRHPYGVAGIGRVVGWELDMAAGVVTPVLLEPDSDDGITQGSPPVIIPGEEGGDDGGGVTTFGAGPYGAGPYGGGG